MGRQAGRQTDSWAVPKEEKLPTINRQMLTVWGTKGARRREIEGKGREGRDRLLSPVP